MGGGRARAAMACVLGTLALVAAGCGAESHANDPRPSPPVRLSVTITDEAITVAPRVVGVGPEPTQQIPQNQGQKQPPISADSKQPLNTVFVSANLTETNSHLEIRGPANFSSGPLYANSNGSYQADLPAGVYTLTAADIPGAKPAKLVVGHYRASSQNDVLLP